MRSRRVRNAAGPSVVVRRTPWYPCPVRPGPSQGGPHHLDGLRSEAHRTPHPATARDRTDDDPPRCQPSHPTTRSRPPERAPRGAAAPRRDDPDRVRPDVGRPARGAPPGPRLGRQHVQLGVGVEAREPHEPGPCRGRPAGPQGRLEADRDRPLPEQGHDRPGLLQPHDPGHELQRVPHPRHEGLLLPDRRREHRLEQLPRRRRHEHDPAPVHGVARPPLEHPRQGLGRGRDRRLQRPGRPEDVDRHLRRSVRLDLAQADPQAHAEAAEGHGEAASDRDPEAEARRDTAPDTPSDTDADARPRWRS